MDNIWSSNNPGYASDHAQMILPGYARGYTLFLFIVTFLRIWVENRFTYSQSNYHQFNENQEIISFYKHPESLHHHQCYIWP